MQDSSTKLAISVSWKTIAVNVGLSGVKLAAGVAAHSQAMVSDAVHTASDVLSTLIVMAGITMAAKSADEGHPYGHERLECVAAILLSVLLCLTGLGIGANGIKTLMSGEAAEMPGVLALAAAVLSVAVKEWMYWYTRAAAKKAASGALMADAWHHRSDALSSVGSFAAILGARLGYVFLDPLASVIICAFILKAAYDVFKDAINKMTDTPCDKETHDKISAVVLAVPGVLTLDLLNTRLFGSRMYVEVEIGADPELTLLAAHDIAQVVHNEIEHHFESVKHCMVHVNPCYPPIPQK